MTSPVPTTRARDRSVCIVGTSRRTWRDGNGGPEPLAMWEEAAREAVADVGPRHDVLGSLDQLLVVHCLSWSYDDPSGRLAHRLGRGDVRHTSSILAGTSPQRLLAQAATEMLAGRSEVAIVVGGEAQASLQRYGRAGETPPWSFPDPHPPSLLASLEEWHLPTELRHGITPAWLTFALLEQARWARRGATADERVRLGDRLAALSATAAANPDAWHRRRWIGAELLTPTASNRAITTPYTKCMTAFPSVDMAAANVLVTRETADRWRVPEDRRVYLRSSAFARDASHVAGRSDLAASPGMAAAMTTALRHSGLALEEIDAFDLYSCFGAALSFAADALGLADDDPRPRSLTGGLPFHGGPGSNYMSHSVSHAVDAIRRGAHENVLVTGIGMHMAKHVAAVWSSEPGPTVVEGEVRQRGALADDAVPVVEHAESTVALEAATVVFDRTNGPERAVAVARLPDGTRCYAASRDETVLDAVVDGKWVDVAAEVRPAADGTNHLLL
jgi:acetyl-CoA C-acetyltransferase